MLKFYNSLKLFLPFAKLYWIWIGVILLNFFRSLIKGIQHTAGEVTNAEVFLVNDSDLVMLVFVGILYSAILKTNILRFLRFNDRNHLKRHYIGLVIFMTLFFYASLIVKNQLISLFVGPAPLFSYVESVYFSIYAVLLFIVLTMQLKNNWGAALLLVLIIPTSVRYISLKFWNISIPNALLVPIEEMAKGNYLMLLGCILLFYFYMEFLVGKLKRPKSAFI